MKLRYLNSRPYFVRSSQQRIFIKLISLINYMVKIKNIFFIYIHYILFIFLVRFSSLDSFLFFLLFRLNYISFYNIITYLFVLRHLSFIFVSLFWLPPFLCSLIFPCLNDLYMSYADQRNRRISHSINICIFLHIFFGILPQVAKKKKTVNSERHEITWWRFMWLNILGRIFTFRQSPRGMFFIYLFIYTRRL